MLAAWTIPKTPKMSEPSNKLKEFEEKDGILYYWGRMQQKMYSGAHDLDFSVLFDAPEITFYQPVIWDHGILPTPTKCASPSTGLRIPTRTWN